VTPRLPATASDMITSITLVVFPEEGRERDRGRKGMGGREGETEIVRAGGGGEERGRAGGSNGSRSGRGME
jgi:hypothetical protein